jgi:hypothetical protein
MKHHLVLEVVWDGVFRGDGGGGAASGAAGCRAQLRGSTSTRHQLGQRRFVVGCLDNEFEYITPAALQKYYQAIESLNFSLAHIASGNDSHEQYHNFVYRRMRPPSAQFSKIKSRCTPNSIYADLAVKFIYAMCILGEPRGGGERRPARAPSVQPTFSPRSPRDDSPTTSRCPAPP